MIHRSLLASGLALISVPATAQLQFTNVTDAAGITIQSRLTQSVAWADYDDDGDPDLYVTGKGPNTLYKNNGDGTFTDVTDATGLAGPATTDGDSIGVVFADLDNDGDLDLFVSQVNDGRDQLYRNEGPTGLNREFVFTEVSRDAGINFASSARGLTSLDYDRDGLLDLYVLATGRNALFKNLGNWTFSDRGNEQGVAPDGIDVGAVATDVNLDGWPDLFVANRSDDPTNLFINTAGSFTDEASAAGINAIGLGMGVVSFDYDNDLDFDLYWTVWPGDGATPVENRFYRNDGGLSFTDVTDVTSTADALGWGISANTADIDNDGWMDLFVTNGFDDTSTPSVLFHNNGDGSFSDITDLLPNMPADARGVAFADYDNDGDLDVLMTATAGEAVTLWRNDTANDNRSIRLVLRGGKGNHSAVNARVVLTTDVGSFTQEVHGSTGRGNQSEQVLHFGLGTASKVNQATIYWPSGQVQILDDLNANETYTLFEAGPQPRQYSGAWFGGPGQAGHGFSVEELSDNSFVVFWYTFDSQGNRTWLVSQGTRNGNKMRGDTYTIDGGVFPPDFDEAATDRVEWGTLEIEFENCTTARARWDTDRGAFSDGSMALTRLSTIAGAECG